MLQAYRLNGFLDIVYIVALHESMSMYVCVFQRVRRGWLRRGCSLVLGESNLWACIAVFLQ